MNKWLYCEIDGSLEWLNLPNVSNKLSKTGLHVSLSSANIQTKFSTCINVCPSLSNSGICSLLKVNYIINGACQLSVKQLMIIPWIGGSYKIDDWHLVIGEGSCFRIMQRLSMFCYCVFANDHGIILN